MSEETVKSYIGCKIIQAVPMLSQDFLIHQGRTSGITVEDRPGYMVTYPDGYESWSPKEVFEQAYREISPAERAMI